MKRLGRIIERHELVQPCPEEIEHSRVCSRCNSSYCSSRSVIVVAVFGFCVNRLILLLTFVLHTRSSDWLGDCFRTNF